MRLPAPLLGPIVAATAVVALAGCEIVPPPHAPAGAAAYGQAPAYGTTGYRPWGYPASGYGNGYGANVPAYPQTYPYARAPVYPPAQRYPSPQVYPTTGWGYAPSGYGNTAPSYGGRPAYPSSAGYAPQPGYGASPAAIVAATVTLYTTSWCDNCRILETQLSARGIPYQLVDVDQNHDAWERASAAAGGRTHIPLTGVSRNAGDVWVEGDDADSIERAYRGL